MGASTLAGMSLVKVALSVLSKEGKWFNKDFKCLRPHAGETILVDSDEFLVQAVALHARDKSLVVRAVSRSRKLLGSKALLNRGFERVD